VGYVQMMTELATSKKFPERSSGSKRRDAVEPHYQISGIELETIIPGRLILIDITLAQASFVAEINL
jgi:hypothetical protein